ncbi:hypothetical protein ACRE_016210 [Hapsidospora chrysogenum ATCC 11550]|uniref:DUF7924 domain-containing protein n=1 Tax=Hapsidospora chrysogenum (strain ATCC 11550 / CBS 779.69 / DSM 880 / IAM 14645 / JCM 23072 / IMI 49137) TaxID=857340 RepID=A0A086TDM2_HAPC1|nr:hypothetical protein ACRE_016210 [Hapsidospora chrysogenum ATCC 11550]
MMPAMNSRSSQGAGTPLSCATTQGVQETVLDAIADVPRPDIEQSPERGVTTRDPTPVPYGKERRDAPESDATPVPYRKKRLDAPESDPLPAKRVRLTRLDAQQSGDEDEKAEQAEQPHSPKDPDASLLKDFVDPAHQGPGPLSLYTFVSEWLESVGLDREKQCRSDSHLRGSNNDPFSRRLTRSAPEMAYRRDTDGFAMPQAPASTPSRVPRATEVSAHSIASVRDPAYRHDNLAHNGIYIRNALAQLPNYISGHVNELPEERDSPGPSSDQVDTYRQGVEQLAEGCTEAEVQRFFETLVFPSWSDTSYGRLTGLRSTQSSLMSSHLVPNNPATPFMVSDPKPDLLYGYSSDPSDGAFTSPQFVALASLDPQNPTFTKATAQGLRFPFLAVEFKAAGGTHGDLWVATNQCAGASSACLNAIHQLNNCLRDHQNVQPVDNLSYSIAMDNNTAQLYVAWMEYDTNYYLQRVGSFLMSDPEHFRRFRKHVRNILDWGKGTRLTQIRDALDSTLGGEQAGDYGTRKVPPTIIRWFYRW